jgi:hypothetical protein
MIKATFSVLPMSQPQGWDGLFFQNDPRPYAAFFEFLQDSSPHIIWGSRDADPASLKKFLWHVMSIPQPESISDEVQKPMIFTASFHEIHYAAFYFSILDIEARGFSRWLCFVLASDNERVVGNALFLHKASLLSLLQSMLDRSNAIFGSEIITFLRAIDELLSTINETSLNYIRLVTKRDLLNEYRVRFNDATAAANGPKPTEQSLLQITENLRGVSELTGIDVILPKIESIVAACSAHPIVLEGLVISPDISFPLPAHSVLFRIPRETLLYVCFAMLSGWTLVLLSEDIEGFSRELYLSLERLLVFRFRGDCRVFTAFENSNLARFAIVLMRQFIGKPAPGVAVWRLERNEFAGPACPDGSFLMRNPMLREQLGDIFEIDLRDHIMRMRDAFIRFAVLYLTKLPRMESELRGLMEMAGLATADEPIFRFWMAAVANKDSIRPVMLANF